MPDIPSHLKQGGWGKVSKILKKELGIYGPIKAIRPKPNHNIVFIEFAHRSAAEFVKEAMKGQPIDLPGIPNFLVRLRWATDPRHLRATLVLERAEKAEKSIKDTFLPEWASCYPDWQQNAHVAQLSYGGTMKDPVAYPDTNAQYGDQKHEADPTIIPADILQKEAQEVTYDATTSRQYVALDVTHADENDNSVSNEHQNPFLAAIKRVRSDPKTGAQDEHGALSMLTTGYGSEDE